MRRILSAVAGGVLTIVPVTRGYAQYVAVPSFPAGSPTFCTWLQEIDVAPGSDGGFTVVWGEFNNTLGSSNAIVTHRFSRDGVAEAPPVRIDTSGWGLYPTITADAGGGFIGAWMYSHDGSPRALYSRRLSAAGVGVGGEGRIDTLNTGPMIAHSVAYRDAGPVYLWKQNGLFIRAYDNFGNALSSAIAVTSNSPSFETGIAALPGGGFIVTWSNMWMTEWSWARIYNADLTPATAEFSVDVPGLVDNVIASSTGEITFVGHAWNDGGPAGSHSEAWFRKFSSSGSPLGDRVIARTAPDGYYLEVDADYDSRGNLLLVWTEYDTTNEVFLPARARAYDASNSPLGPDFIVADARADSIRTAALSDGCFANAWYGNARAYANVVCLCGGENSSCGDGNVDAQCEACDDGNTTDGDGCDSNCTLPACGNGVVSPGEGCDDGNRADSDGCDSNCTPTACGNGVRAGAEQCDDGNLVDDDGCDANCRPSGCGNGTAGAGEACDDGDQASGDGCDANCTVSRCGNGIAAGGEACDDGNETSGDGCDTNCTLSACGNGIAVGEEECDDANRTSGDGCDKNCLIEFCGNGRREANEQCDSGGAPEGEDAGCNPDCTLRAVHDSVVFAVDPIELSIPVGNSPFPSNVVVQVQNADVTPERESPGHTIRLTASDGDCPPGTAGQPDFDRGVAGVQDTTVVEGGVPSTAIAEVTVSRDAFTPFDHKIPTRCTLWFTAEEASGASDDPTPDNNVASVHLDVTDTDDPVHSDEDEFFIDSMDPITIKIPNGQTVVTKQIKPVVRRSRDLPDTAGDLEVTVSVSDGDCPPGTVGYIDFDKRLAGHQSRMMLRRGRRAKGTLGLVVRAEVFDSPSDESPRRCTALITANGYGDSDPSNNTTRLVIDVVDRNDF
ncbi:MAG TPA: DUF4215 domain-containing protein [Candidatus Limnocylindrales bacterium]|nr:DUF4215 domain-containing protein [Candidatus Limnocylindrales bacterium]